MDQTKIHIHFIGKELTEEFERQLNLFSYNRKKLKEQVRMEKTLQNHILQIKSF